jgi:hypothetical protein
MVKRPSHQINDSRDDADARGEHVYGSNRPRRALAVESEELVRRPGHYVAGANGTQDIAAANKTEDVLEPKRSSQNRDP